MGKINLTKTPLLILFVVIISIGFTAGGVYANHTTTTHTGDVVIEQSEAGTGKLSVIDNNLGIRTTAGGQMIHALRDDGLVGSFRVEGINNSPAFFSIRSTGGTPNLLLADDDTGQTYLWRISQPDTDRLDIVDNTAGAVRMSITKDGNVGIGIQSPSEELEVNGQILGDPIVGKWRPDSSTLVNNIEYVKWDIEDFNTDPTYFGFTAGQDHIKILKSGTYQITANVLTIAGALGESMKWDLFRTSSGGVDQEYLCRNQATMAGGFYQSSCTTIQTFASNERVRLHDNSAVNGIFADMDGPNLPGFNGFTSLVIERLN